MKRFLLLCTCLMAIVLSGMAQDTDHLKLKKPSKDFKSMASTDSLGLSNNPKSLVNPFIDPADSIALQKKIDEFLKKYKLDGKSSESLVDEFDNMPIKKFKEKYPMLIAVPDSTIKYHILIKKHKSITRKP
ncbi:hypothetical protein EYV94_21255 [Puteibacter caeruleilacunae]|nr:hypothetical protein EYV94_21255 [Puteibacter caeruleilacunae]